MADTPKSADNSNALEDVDPLFSKSKKAGTKDDFYVQDDSGSAIDLEGMDDIFKDKPRTPSSTPSAPKREPKSTNPVVGTVAGAITGAVLDRVKPTEWKAPNTSAASSNVAAAEARVNSLRQTIAAAKAGKSPIASDIMKQLEGAQAVLDQKRAELNSAKQEASRFGISSVESAVPEGMELSGDKWNRKVVGDLGPGAASSTEAARNYQLQQSLSPAEASKFRAARSGLIVPNTLENTKAYFGTAMSNVHDLFSKAQAEYEAAQQQVLKLQSALEKAAGPGRMAQLSNALDTAQTVADAAKAKLSSLASQAPPSMVQAGKFISKIPFSNIASGAFAGYDAAQAYDDYKQDNYTDAAFHGMGALSGALMATPHYYAKGVGAAMAIPPLAYEAYKYFKKPDENAFDPGSGSNQSWD
jgi:hypothetical protein